MSERQSIIELRGIVLELLPGAKFIVQLENGSTIKAYPSGKMRINNINILLGDKVKLEISPYDLTIGRITFREK